MAAFSEESLLEQFLHEPDAAKRRSLLEPLLVQTVRPVLERTLKRLFHGEEAAEREELVAAGMASVLEHLLAVGPEFRITSLSAYASAVGYNLYRGYLRQRYPERARLVARVRYVLRMDRRLALWVGTDGASLAGLASWSGRPAVATSSPVLRDLALPQSACELPLAELICRLALHRGGPWPLPELLTALAELLGIRDEPLVPLGGSIQSPEGKPDPGLDPLEPAPSAERKLLDREALLALWQEVRLLPVRQRQALLLNLRDAQGGDLLSLLPLAEVTSWGDIARCLEIKPEQLSSLLPRLPLEDRELARWMGGVTARQVINLRKTARARLARRLRHWIGWDGPPRR